MLTRRFSRNSGPRREWLRRLDRLAADLNVLLALFAVGLAVLDVTFLRSQHLADHLPAAMHGVDEAAPQAQPDTAAVHPSCPSPARPFTDT